MRLDFEHSCCGARNGRDQNKSPDGALTARSGLMVLVYDRPLLRSSARGDGALIAKNDRFAIGLREPGCEHPGYCGGGVMRWSHHLPVVESFQTYMRKNH